MGGSTNEEIQGGARRGANLFHSFREFNIDDGRGAYFANPAGVNHIFSRVTGNNLSNIEGTLGVLGNADLYLINPNGILFEMNARLNLSGSFLASTAETITFPDGRDFSTQINQDPPLLSINVPTGLQWGNRSAPVMVKESNLSVEEGQSLALSGGDVQIEDGQLEAPGGRVDLSGVAPDSVINFESDADFSIPEDMAKAKVTLTNSTVNVVSTVGGNIDINAENVDILEGSSLLAGSDGITEAQSGDISINAIDKVFINQASNISNNAFEKGNSGDVEIEARSLILKDGAFLSASTFGKGDAGTVKVKAIDSVLFQGEDSQERPSGAISGADSGADGNARDVAIETRSLILQDGAFLSASTLGKGNAGTVKVKATDSVLFQGESSQGRPSSASSDVEFEAQGNAGGVEIEARSLILKDGAFLSASTFGKGNAGIVKVKATDSVLFQGESSQGSSSDASSQVRSGAQGDAGGVEIEARSLILKDGAFLSASTFGKGDAGIVKVKATDSVLFQGENFQGRPSSATSDISLEDVGNAGGVALEPQGDAGGVEIETRSLILKDGAFLSASTFGKGNAGIVKVKATDSVLFQGERTQGLPSLAISQVAFEAQGDAGGVEIETRSLILKDGAALSASTLGKGNAGTVKVKAADSVLFQGETSQGRPSSAISQVAFEAQGDAGGVEIETRSLILKDGAFLSSGTSGQGDAGTVKVKATDSVLFQGESSQGSPSFAISEADSEAQGDAGGVEIETQSLILKDGAALSASTLGEGDAGTVKVKATDSVLFQGESSQGLPSAASSQVGSEAQGNAGGIEIETRSLILKNGAFLSSGTRGQGNAGTVKVKATDSVLFQGESSQGLPSAASSQVEFEGQGNAGGIEIETRSLILKNGAALSASTLGKGDAGTIQVKATDSVSIEGESSQGGPSFAISQVGSEAQGNAGDIEIETRSLILQNGATISAGTFTEEDAGNIFVRADILSLTDGSQIRSNTENAGAAGNIIVQIYDLLSLSGKNTSILANTAVNSTGNGGSIFIDPINVVIENGAQIAVNSQGIGQGGDLRLISGSLTLDNGTISAETASNLGGNIELDIDNLLLLRNNSLISATAGTNQAGGDGGSLDIDTALLVAFPQENSDITANAFEGKGGNIQITAQGVFGIEFRDQLTPNSDIAASSNFGTDGTVQLDTSLDPSSGLVQLPVQPPQPQQVAQTCKPSGSSAQSEFVHTGRGGIPPTSQQVLNQRNIDVGWVSLDAKNNKEHQNPSVSNPQSPITSDKPPTPQLVEAQGWTTTQDGKIRLTASTTNTPRHLAQRICPRS
nr:filamentous hemagglutinin N-terminal domain-containing protein [Acaryochloris sp. IP29b_bin.148]